MHIFEHMGSGEYSREYKEFKERIAGPMRYEGEAAPRGRGEPGRTGIMTAVDPWGNAFGSGYGNQIGSDGAKWRYGLANSGVPVLLNHWMLRANARNAYHDSLPARAIVQRYADTVVNTGLRIEAQPAVKVLGIEPEAADKWAADVNARFHLWASDKRSIRNETMTFYQAQRLVEIYQQRDNDYFVRLFYTKSPKLLNPLQIAFVDPGQIRGDAFTSTYGFPVDDDGIQRDAAGREIGYQLFVQKNGEYKPIVVPAWGPRSKRRLMIHGFQPEYCNQGRGYSRLSHALQEFENLTDFTAAQIKKAINQSNIAMYVKPSENNAASNPMEGLTLGQAAGPITPDSGTLAPSGSGVSLEDNLQFVALPEATMKEPGSLGIFSLQEGEILDGFKHTAPAESFPEFVNAFMTSLAASANMPMEVLLMKFEQNYSASRAALILFWQVAAIWRDELKADFIDPIYEMWLSEEIAAGRVSAPGWSDPILRRAWMNNNLIGCPMPNIDPMRTAKADKAYAEMGAQTLDHIAQKLNGSSGSANRAQLSREYEELATPPWTPVNGG